ncbi:MAG: chitobiase/beta-hexosaminidase C-terminal domain-containing protein, partial [Candidatus Paceibacterota bacterium]
LVEKGKVASFFNADWRNSSDLELVASFGKNAAKHHIHSANSAHHLVRLATNEDGTIGSNNLDISDDFWIILYSNSPNSNRGWNLAYQVGDSCMNADNRWYIGNQSSWGGGMTSQVGCPDAHIHLARRDLSYLDGISATTTALYENEIVTENDVFYFSELPNLAPNPTSFISPVAGSIYDGDSITVSWNPATDPNEGDNLNYNIYINDGSATTTLVASSTATSYTWDISAVNDGDYTVLGEVCDDATTPICSQFYLIDSFEINKVKPIYSLSNFSIYSSNPGTPLAKAGDTIYLSFESSGSVNPSVSFFSGGNAMGNSPVLSSDSNSWTVSYLVDNSDSDGTLDYVITASNLDQEYSSSTPITIDNTKSSDVSVNYGSGSYTSNISVTLGSVGSSWIRYTLDSTQPDCQTGHIYVDPINISSDTNLKVVACDEAGNQSNLLDLSYFFSSSGGSGGKIRKVEKLELSGDSLEKVIEEAFQMLKKKKDPMDINKLKEILKYLEQKIKEINETKMETKIESPRFIFTKNLSYGMTDKEVKLLQKLLNEKNYSLAESGAGSSGNETDYFGNLTKKALIRLQKNEGVRPALGYFGPITREALKRKGWISTNH